MCLAYIFCIHYTLLFVLSSITVNYNFTNLGKNKYAGGNSVCDRPTPDWQKGIGGFLLQSPKAKGKENSTPSDEVEAGGNSECSSSQSSDAG